MNQGRINKLVHKNVKFEFMGKFFRVVFPRGGITALYIVRVTHQFAFSWRCEQGSVTI